MTLKRRDLLAFLGVTVGSATLAAWDKFAWLPKGQPTPKLELEAGPAHAALPEGVMARVMPSLPFQPVLGPIPLPTDGMASDNPTAYRTFQVQDDVVLPDGFTYDIVATWGDRLGDARVGYNNDFLALLETGANQGLLTVNFEYISPHVWMETYAAVMGQSLPFAELQAAIAAAGDRGINAFALPADDRTKHVVRVVCEAAMMDVGIGVMALRRTPEGRWVRTAAVSDRRVTGISGLTDGHYLKATGPAVAVFTKTSKQGYDDRLGERVIGTCSNCAGGITPWGTVFSAEENFQSFVPEAVYADGSAFDPGAAPLRLTAAEMLGIGNVFGLAGNKYGWMVEIDPTNPQDYGTKHTWLGRFRHEAIAVRAEAGKPLACYSGCDRRGGHLYKFVSAETVRNPQDKGNSRLLSQGMLYAAKFNPDGTGRWIALKPDTRVNPDLPSIHAGEMIPLPQRPDGGFFRATEDAQAIAFQHQFSTLGDLYTGTALEKQGAILIDAHFAANAAGATCTARPEDADLRPDGTLFIAFTSGSPSSRDGSPDLRIFQGPDGQAYEHGWLMKLMEAGNDPAAMTFRWTMLAMGGEPADGGAGFSNPDNLLFDAHDNLWMVTDISSDQHNRAVPAGRLDSTGKPISQSNLRGLFGNNSIWMIPTQGPQAGHAYLFGYGPMECEICGPWFSRDQTTLFLAIQHPGEINGTRRNLAQETRSFALRTIAGTEFLQSRQVPIGSNWPGKATNDPPKPAVIAVRRLDGRSLT
ncbi:PhoX family protein [Trichothermofontia sp.]